jgi:hypothetical protein
MNPNVSALLLLKGGEKQEMRDEKLPTAHDCMVTSSNLCFNCMPLSFFHGALFATCMFPL